MKQSPKGNMKSRICHSYRTNAHPTSHFIIFHEPTTSTEHTERWTKYKSSSTRPPITLRDQNTSYWSDRPDIYLESLSRFINCLHYAIYSDANDNNSNSNRVYGSFSSKSTRTTSSSSVLAETSVLQHNYTEQQSPISSTKYKSTALPRTISSTESPTLCEFKSDPNRLRYRSDWKTLPRHRTSCEPKPRGPRINLKNASRSV